jgi:putative phage-type endonuclease
MSTIVNLVQGSAEWLGYRRSMRNASEAAAVLGISPWVTPYQLWLLKTGRKEQAVNAAMLNGTALEPEARSAYELETGHVMQPLVMQDGDYSASLDGITLQGDLIVEIKCPMRGADSALWREVSDGQAAAYYSAQIQHQLMVSGAARAHLWVFDGSQGLLLAIERDDAAMAAIREAWDAFWQFIVKDTPPPLSDSDTMQRVDEPWLRAAEAYGRAKRAAQLADGALEDARQRLIGLTAHPREEGGGVSVTRYWKAGTVDYKKIVCVHDVDVAAYRGRIREEIRVTAAST